MNQESKMNLSQEVKPYKKVDGIYEEKEKLVKWKKFLLSFGKFLAKGLAGKWEIGFKIKF